MEQFEAAFLDDQEVGAERAPSNARARKRDRNRRDDAAGPRSHHVDLVGEIDCFLDVMGDEQHGLAEVAPELHQPFLHLELGLGVERPERLIQQYDVGVEQQGAQQRGALAHAAGQRVRIEIFEAGQSVAMKQRQRALARRAQRHVLNLHAENGVVEYRAPGQQQVLLQHIADAADGAGGVDAVDQYPAAGRLQQSGDDVENSAFAAARRADQAHETALRIDSVIGASAWKAPVGVLNVMLTSATQSFGAEDDMRTPLDRVAARIPQSPGTISQKPCQQPSPFACVHGLRSEFRGRRPMTANYSLCTSFRQPCRGCRMASGNHLASTFAALGMGDQRAISAFTKLSNFAGVRSSLVGSDPPRSASRVWTPGSSSAWSSAAASLSMMPFGVPLGAKIPAQMLIR